jgi:SAM-dependent methyltransferase
MARWYRALEFLAFGGDLERARFAHLGRLRDRRSILLLGEGDGRCAERVALLVPRARILCVDSSPEMIERARARIGALGALDRVRFECADLRCFEPEPGAHDAVTTFFVLDCLRGDEVAAVIPRVGAALQPGAPWLFADFVIPPGGPARLRARAWLGLLYAFFRWETGLRVSRLPPSESLIEGAGWRRTASLGLQAGLLRSSVYERDPG